MSDMLTASPGLMRHLDATQAEHSDAAFKRGYIRTMPLKWRAVLMRHADQRQQVNLKGDDLRIQRALVRRNLLRYDRPDRPRYTIPTRGGLEIVCAMLAEEAEKELEHLEP